MSGFLYQTLLILSLLVSVILIPAFNKFTVFETNIGRIHLLPSSLQLSLLGRLGCLHRGVCIGYW
jgi:hypothetical protein